MHETLRRRIVRRMETLPEPQLYQVLDYIEFLESRYARGVPEASSALQGLAERLEDGLRSRTVSPSRLREAFQLIGAADRALRSVSEAGREILSELQVMGDELPQTAAPPAPAADDHREVGRDEAEAPPSSMDGSPPQG